MTKRIMAAAVALIVFLLCATVQVRDDPETTPSPVSTPVTTPSWEEMGYAELSWVIEGIMERISGLEDDLERVQEIQNKKLTEAGLGPAFTGGKKE